MKIRCTRGFGLVEGPDGNNINIEQPVTVSEQVGEYLLSEYPGMEVVEDEPAQPTNEDGDPLCVGKEDGQCNRVVEEPGDTCWQH